VDCSSRRHHRAKGIEFGWRIGRNGLIQSAALAPAQTKDVGDYIVGFVAAQMKVWHPCMRRLQEGAKR
jgi:hypothetical protein